jgi:hypothetical protein
MRGLMHRAPVVAGAVVALLGPAVGAASAPAGAAGTSLAAGARALSGGAWGSAEEVPGIGALNQGGSARIVSVSCAWAGRCGAGGQYTDRSGHVQALVVSQVRGTWGKAIEVPGTAALNQGGNAAVASVSCAWLSGCSGGGQYTDRFGHVQAFVVSQVRGTWGKAIEVPGIAALNQGGNATIFSVSCAWPGSCSAGGVYSGRYGHGQAFVVSQVRGTWGSAEEVPGTAALNQRGPAVISSVSCAGPGSCGAGGAYKDKSGHSQAFVVSQVHGTWGRAQEVPGTVALNLGGFAGINSVSCAWPGGCSAGGIYIDRSGHVQAFVVSQVRGTWGKAIEVPGMAALNLGGFASVNSVSCPWAGTCSAAGQYSDRSGHSQAFVVSEVRGSWDTAEPIPGTAALNQGGGAAAYSVSCGPAGTCSAGGLYTDGSGHQQAFVVNKVNGGGQFSGSVAPRSLAPRRRGAARCGSACRSPPRA